VVAVEASTNVADPWSTAPYELAKVTRPWAIENKIEIVPIGWNEPNYSAQLGQMFQKIAAAGKAAEFQQVEQDFQTRSAQHTMTAARMNDAEALRLWRDYHAKLHEFSDGDTPWEQWNAKIVDNLLALCRKQRGKRIAVVFGGAHAYYFVDRLSGLPEIRVMPTEEFFPLSKEEIRAATTDADYLQAMRLLNFEPGSLGPSQLAHIERQLNQLKGVKQYQNDYDYFKARLLLHQQNADEALKLLSGLSDVKRGMKLKFDGMTPVREAARLQTYFALVSKGDAEAALSTIRQLAEDETVTLPIRQTAEAILKADTPD
jgi:hypothetical protein